MTMPSFVTDWAIRSSIVILAGILLLWAFRIRNSCTRRAVLVAVLCASLATPVLTAVLPAVALTTALPATQISAPVVIPAFTAASAPTARNAEQSAADVRRFDARQLAFIAYAVVSGILLVRLAVGLVLSMRLLRRSRSTELRWNGIDIRECDLSVPVTLGFLRPAILLPENWREWDRLKLQAVLAHEGSHVRRWDPLVQAVSVIHRALLWFTPLSWLLHRQIVTIAEEASDDAALAAMGDRASYAEILLDFMSGPSLSRGCQAVAMARHGSPESRIRRILNGTTVSRGIKVRSLALIIALVTPGTCLVAAARPGSPAPKTAVSATVAVAPLAATSSSAPAKTEHGVKPAPVAAQQSQASTPVQSSSRTQASQPAATTARRIRRYVIVHGGNTSGSWDSEDDTSIGELRNRYGDHFAWFRTDGRDYLITDPGVLAEIDKAMEPQKGVNQMQGGVNDQQAKVNELQARVNNMQQAVNALQQQVNQRQNLVNQIQNAVSNGDNGALIQKLEAELQQLRSAKADVNQALVNQKQSEVNHEQSGVNAEQSKVNAAQGKVNEEQSRVSAEFERRIQEIFASALQSGRAKPLN